MKDILFWDESLYLQSTMTVKLELKECVVGKLVVVIGVAQC